MKEIPAWAKPLIQAVIIALATLFGVRLGSEPVKSAVEENTQQMRGMCVSVQPVPAVPAEMPKTK